MSKRQEVQQKLDDLIERKRELQAELYNVEKPTDHVRHITWDASVRPGGCCLVQIAGITGRFAPIAQRRPPMSKRESRFKELPGSTVYVAPDQLVITGMPDEDDESHKCDEMGCSSVEHVLYRFNLPIKTGGRS